MLSPLSDALMTEQQLTRCAVAEPLLNFAGRLCKVFNVESATEPV